MPLPPPQPGYPSPPPTAIPFTDNGSQIPIYYNQTVILQCMTSGVVSPVFIIRKVDHQTTVVGGGLQEGAKGVADHYCAPGEVCGDPVSQLHKIAFEVFDPNKGAPEPGTYGTSGAFLSCMGEKVNTYRPVDGRQWNDAHTMPERESDPLGAAQGSPPPSSPMSSTGSVDHFGVGSNSSVPPSPDPSDYSSNEGGRVKKTKRGSFGGRGIRPSSQNSWRRSSSAGSASSDRHRPGRDSLASSGALWQVDVGETGVWTIAGIGEHQKSSGSRLPRLWIQHTWRLANTPSLVPSDQIRYNFYVPPVLFDQRDATLNASFPIPTKPVTPFPVVVKYLPLNSVWEPHSKSIPHTSKMLTVYGENFSETDPTTVFFGSDPSPYVDWDSRFMGVLRCLPPETQTADRRPIILVRHDGVVFPSDVYYP